MRNRILSMLLILCMLVSLMPVSVFAEDVSEEGAIFETEEANAEILEEIFAHEDTEELLNDESSFEVPHEHCYEAVVTEPTCTAEGYTTYSCECGDSYVSDYVDALNHSETEDIPETAATCTESGISSGIRCTICGELLEGCVEIPAIGHDTEYIPEVPATEYSTGITSGVRCAVCGEILEGFDEIPMLEPVPEAEQINDTEQESEPEVSTDTIGEFQSEPVADIDTATDVFLNSETEKEELEIVEESYGQTDSDSEALPESEEQQNELSLEQSESLELNIDDTEFAEPFSELNVFDEEPANHLVRIIFNLTPSNAELSLYSRNKNGDKTEYLAESDGSYMRSPGVYYYTLTADGYLTVNDAELIVDETSEPIYINAEMISTILPLDVEDGEDIESRANKKNIKSGFPTNTSFDTAIEITEGVEFDLVDPFAGTTYYYSFTPLITGVYSLHYHTQYEVLNCLFNQCVLYNSTHEIVAEAIYIEDSGCWNELRADLTVGETYYIAIDNQRDYSDHYIIEFVNELNVTAETSQITVERGERATLRVNVTGTVLEGITYTWEKSYSDGNAEYHRETIEGASGAELVTDPITTRTMFNCTVRDVYRRVL